MSHRGRHRRPRPGPGRHRKPPTHPSLTLGVPLVVAVGLIAASSSPDQPDQLGQPVPAGVTAPVSAFAAHPVAAPVERPVAASPRPLPKSRDVRLLLPATVVLADPPGGPIPPSAMRAYRAAAAQAPCRLSWRTLAAIGAVSQHGRGPADGPLLDGSQGVTFADSDRGVIDGDPRFDRTVGPMRWLPWTWARWAADGDHDGKADPRDVDDASLAAARYLCAVSGDLRAYGLRHALSAGGRGTSHRS